MGALTLGSILDTRYAVWIERLFDHGYDASLTPIHAFSPATTISIRARRLVTFGAPQVTISIVETWAAGPDPRLGLDAQGCHLLQASWHAQIDPTQGGASGERFEVDRVAHPDLPLHRHPFGQANDVRWPEPILLAPEQWLQQVEDVAFAAMDDVD